MRVPDRYIFKSALLEALLFEAQAAHPKECCGLLWTRERKVISEFTAFPGTLKSRSFSLPESWILSQFYEKKQIGLRLSAFYHSHPGLGPMRPSRRDLVGHPPGALFLILSPRDEEKGFFQRGFDSKSYRELSFSVE